MSSFKAAIYTGLALALTACTSTPPPEGESLSGYLGAVKQNLPITKGNCGKLVSKYKAASGHSAYASTKRKMSSGSFICGTGLNKKSVEEAKAAALRQCESGTTRWSKAYDGKCTIHAWK